ncbi:GNAT family N-acetyltransferase [Streptomyces sp. UH6]|uniref:GNAT family N-acetyltransferase n=1 Tax=Streptomyces sp. UH6 TaxID=2748379 RepID=UPI0015D505F5|nr:GNAT family N-acetyltransferase [Streptomyces sp. UH6]NYV74467.1 GNAT family N-acetyltransferase [Streptomyces sp. UH6]
MSTTSQDPPLPVARKLTLVRVPVSDPRVRPLLEELRAEYSGRYGGDAGEELGRHPDEEFAPGRDGLLILLLQDGETVAGGAFRRYDAVTAELKRIWTHSVHRRRGLARRVVAALEREAGLLGYRRIVLTTGPRQPEARALYLATGYTPLFDTEAHPEDVGLLTFEKHLPPGTTVGESRADPHEHR